MSLTQKIGQVIALSTLIFGSFIPTAFSATTPQKNAQESKPQTLLAQSTVRKGNFKFQTKNCKRSNGKVICGLIVTNISKENRRLAIYINRTNAIDLYGNPYKVKKISIGEESGKYDIYRVMLPGIPIKINHYFAIPQNVSKLAGIQYRTRNGIILLRNVPIGNSERVKGGHNCQ
ncbi:MAG: hypothetical protein AAF757_00975 [Cyanobacteria bacterium P01_D01_bin.116]